MKSKILFVIFILSILFTSSTNAGDPYKLDEDLEMGENDLYNATNVNSTNLYQDGNKVLDVTDVNSTDFNYSLYANSSEYWDEETSQSDLDVNSSTWWNDVSGWVSRWFYKNGNDFDFNETLLNSTIDERSDFDTNWPINITSLDNQSGTLGVNESWLDGLFARISDLVGYLGNWSADKSSYSNTSTVQSWIDDNYSVLDTKIDSVGNWTNDQSNYYNNTEVYTKTETDTEITTSNSSMKTYVDVTFITQANEGNLNVNSSNYWDVYDIPSDLNNLVTIPCDNISGATSDLCSIVGGNATNCSDSDSCANIVYSTNTSWVTSNQITYTNSSFDLSQISNTANISSISDNEYLCLGSSGCSDSYLYFNGSALIIKVN